MRAAPLAGAVLLLLAGCGPREPQSLDHNLVEDLARHGTAGGAAGPTGGTGLQPLAPADLGGAAAICQLVTPQGPLLAYVAGAGLVKRQGQVIRLTPEGLIDQTGGFFNSDTMSISVGRVTVGEASANMQGPRSLRARARVNDRLVEDSVEFDGEWRCGGA